MSPTKESRPGIPRTAISMTGFVFVAFLCILAGFALGSENTPIANPSLAGLVDFFSAQPGRFTLMMVFLLIISPFYFFREATLEREYQKGDPKLDDFTHLLGIGIPFWFAVIFAVVALLVLTLVLPNFETIAPELAIRIFALYVLGILPFFSLALRLYRKLRVEDTYEEFSFTEKVLFPALTTVLVPFSFGWAVSIPEIDLLAPVIGAGLILIIISTTRRFPYGIVSTISAMLVASVLSILLPEFAQLRIVVYGSILSLAMGVSETGKRVFLSHRLKHYHLEREDEDFYLAGSNWASIIFPLTLAIVPLLIDIFPPWPILYFITFQSLYWLFIEPHHKKTLWAAGINVLLGYLLPVIFILTPVFGWHTNPIPTVLDNLATGMIPVILLIVGIIIAANINSVRAENGKNEDAFGAALKKYNSRETYLDKTESYFLFLVSLLVLIVVVYLVSVFITFITGTASTATDAKQIIFWATLMMVFIGSRFVIRRYRTGQKINKDGGSPMTSLLLFLDSLRMVIESGRPVSSGLAGLAVMVFVLVKSTYSFLGAIGIAIPMVLITMSGFLLNDIFDYRKDRRAGINRPIAQGDLSRETAITFVVLFTVVALAMGMTSANIGASVVLVLTFLGVFLYSPFAHKVPVMKGFATATLTLMPAVYAEQIGDFSIPSYLYFSMAIFIVGRELLLDTKHFNFDKKSDFLTLVHYLGRSISSVMAWCLMFIGFIIFMFFSSHPIALLISSLAFTMLAVSLVYDSLFTVKDGGLTIVSMILGIIAMPFAI